MNSFYSAVKKAYRCCVRNADVIYSHFLNPAGIAAVMLKKDTGRPVFVACGESGFESELFAIDMYRDELKAGVDGVIAVSSENKRKLVELALFAEDKIKVLPNGVDFNEFPITNKSEARSELEIPENAFVVIFVGHFIERKGINELIRAAKMSNKWSCIFVGRGNLPDSCDNVLYCGSVLHSQLYKYLYASDVFVLPTKAEGCCNAIIEALACGLPVVSSNLPFNDDILRNDFSIRINPNCVNEIFEAVEKVRCDYDLRINMAKKAAEYGGKFNISKRAESILRYMNEVCF